MLTLYDYLPSQNAYKVRLLFNHLETDHRTRLVSIFEGEGQNDADLDVNPTGAVPAIEPDDGRTLAEPNAILIFLADGPGRPAARRVSAHCSLDRCGSAPTPVSRHCPHVRRRSPQRPRDRARHVSIRRGIRRGAYDLVLNVFENISADG